MVDSMVHVVDLLSAYTVEELLQEAQLSQRDRATLRVIEYFAVTQGQSRSFEMTLLSRACVSPY